MHSSVPPASLSSSAAAASNIKRMRYMQCGLTSRSEAQAQGQGLASGQGLGHIASGQGLDSEGGRGSGLVDGDRGNMTSLPTATSTPVHSNSIHDKNHADYAYEHQTAGMGVPRLITPYHMIATSVPNQSHVPISTSQQPQASSKQAQASSQQRPQAQAQAQPAQAAPSSRPVDSSSSAARAIAQAIHAIADATHHDKTTSVYIPSSTAIPSPSYMER